MTTAEMDREIQEREARFYAWGHDEFEDPLRKFKCWQISGQYMDNARCQARARKPELYENAGCSLKCPRWKHYRKIFKAKIFDDGYERMAYR